MPGWTRYWVAEQMLARVATNAAPAGRGALSGSATANTSAPIVDETDPLYREFLEWRRKQRR